MTLLTPKKTLLIAPIMLLAACGTSSSVDAVPSPDITFSTSTTPSVERTLPTGTPKPLPQVTKAKKYVPPVQKTTVPVPKKPVASSQTYVQPPVKVTPQWTRKPTNTVSRSVTRPPATSRQSSRPVNNGGMWDSIAKCESGNNWNTNTGNGYYGGLQFDVRTWLGAGGGQFAPRADLATREQQITIANKVYQSRGLQPWSCGWAAKR